MEKKTKESGCPVKYDLSSWENREPLFLGYFSKSPWESKMIDEKIAKRNDEKSKKIMEEIDKYKTRKKMMVRNRERSRGLPRRRRSKKQIYQVNDNNNNNNNNNVGVLVECDKCGFIDESTRTSSSSSSSSKSYDEEDTTKSCKLITVTYHFKCPNCSADKTVLEHRQQQQQEDEDEDGDYFSEGDCIKFHPL